MIDLAQFGLSGSDMLKVMDMASEYAPKIRELTSKIDTFLPMVKQYEQKYNCSEGQTILYTIAVTNTNAFIYVVKVEQNSDKQVVHKEYMERFELKALIEKLLQYLP